MTFLLLNMFLVHQLDEKNNANQISMLTEATLQERLNEMNVTIDVEFTDEQYVGIHLVGKTISFSEEIISELDKQDVRIINDTFLVSRMFEPVSLLPTGTDEFDASDYLKSYIYNGGEYRLGRHNEETNELVFYQIYDEKMVYSYDEVPLTLVLDEDNRVIGYQQSYFELEEQGREQEVLAPMKAIEILLNERVIVANQTVSDVEFCYYSLFKPLGDVQVFAPMWRITVEDEYYLVNAIDGSVQNIN